LRCARLYPRNRMTARRGSCRIAIEREPEKLFSSRSDGSGGHQAPLLLTGDEGAAGRSKHVALFSNPITVEHGTDGIERFYGRVSCRH